MTHKIGKVEYHVSYRDGEWLPRIEKIIAMSIYPELKKGDRVTVEEMIGTPHDPYTYKGAVVDIRESGAWVCVKRDDGERGTGPDGSFITHSRFCTRINAGDPAELKFPKSEKKGYTPDGPFDASAHADFMKNL